MMRAQLIVPVCHHEQRRRACHTATEESEQIERRLVRPVDIFADDDGRTSLQFIENSAEDSRATGARVEECWQVPLRLPDHILQRAQRAGCEQSIAGTPQYSHRAA